MSESFLSSSDDGGSASPPPSPVYDLSEFSQCSLSQRSGEAAAVLARAAPKQMGSGGAAVLASAAPEEMGAGASAGSAQHKAAAGRKRRSPFREIHQV